MMADEAMTIRGAMHLAERAMRDESRRSAIG